MGLELVLPLPSSSLALGYRPREQAAFGRLLLAEVSYSRRNFLRHAPKSRHVPSMR